MRCGRERQDGKYRLSFVKRPLAAVVATSALLLPLVGCDAFGDNVAATVAGHDITIEQVRGLAAARSEQAPGEDTIDATAARGALAELVQLQAYSAELRRKDGSASSQHREEARQMVDGLVGVKGDLKAELMTLYADRAALLEMLNASVAAEEPTDEEIRARAVEMIEGAPPEQLVVPCAVGVFGPTDAAAGVQELIDGGADVGDGTAFESANFSPIGLDGAPFCGLVGNADIDDAVTNGAVGVVRRVDFQSQQGAQTVFLRPTGTKTYTAEDPEIIAAATSQLQQEAQLLAQANQSKLQATWDAEILGRAGVHIDPRLGRFDPKDVVRPPAGARAGT